MILVIALAVSIVSHGQPVNIEEPNASLGTTSDDVQSVKPSESPSDVQSDMPTAVLTAAPTTVDSATLTLQLQHDLQTLRSEVANLQQQMTQAPSGRFVDTSLTSQQFMNLGAIGSKIYFSSNPVTLGLSAEVLGFFERRGDNDSSSKDYNRSSTLSLAPTIGANLSKQILFNSRLLFENGGSETDGTVTAQRGQAIVQYAYVEFFFESQRRVGIRVGHQLLPIGWLNPLEEPQYFHSVQKPGLERELIPSSWHENGILLWTRLDQFYLQTGIFNSLDASGFRSSTLLGDGRQRGQNAKSEDLMSVTRLDWSSPGLTLGASYSYGDTSQGNASIDRGTVTIWEAHGNIEAQALQISAVYSEVRIDDSESISLVNSSTIPEMAKGYYVTLGFDLAKAFQFTPIGKLPIFVRHSEYDLQDRLIGSSGRNKLLDKIETAVGLNWQSKANSLLKLEYIFKDIQSGDADDEFALGLALFF